MSFTHITHTQRGGWSPRTPTNEAFVATLAAACTDAYDREFSELVPAWRVYMNTGVVEYLCRTGDPYSDGTPYKTWHYVGRFDKSGRFVADAQADPVAYIPHTDGVYDDGVDAITGCCGNGLFFNGGGVENGVYTGKIGNCFPCNGKGYQTREDRTRNAVYNAKYRRVYA